MKKIIYYKKYIFLVIYVVITLFLCYQALQSSVVSQNTSNKFQEVIEKTPPYQYFDTKIPNFDKVTRKLFGHFLLYSLLGLFSYLTYSSFIKEQKIAQTTNLLSGLFLASFTEFLQIFATGRAPAIQDIIINYEGFLLSNGLVLTIIFLIFINSNEKLKENLFDYITVFSLIILFELLFIILAEKLNSLKFCNGIYIICNILWLMIILIKYLIINIKNHAKSA